mmetsp:Transcript_19357/g.68488  ORF Transcript_19357/g.68488 Transcript_19357/m.68488 type:complete len:226 (+) Transcript_19357:884-1561(+)
MSWLITAVSSLTSMDVSQASPPLWPRQYSGSVTFSVGSPRASRTACGTPTSEPVTANSYAVGKGTAPPPPAESDTITAAAASVSAAVPGSANTLRCSTALRSKPVPSAPSAVSSAIASGRPAARMATTTQSPLPDTTAPWPQTAAATATTATSARHRSSARHPRLADSPDALLSVRSCTRYIDCSNSMAAGCCPAPPPLPRLEQARVALTCDDGGDRLDACRAHT